MVEPQFGGGCRSEYRRSCRSMPGWLLLGLAVLGVMLDGAGAGDPKHIPRFAFDRHESPLSLPLTVRVVLVNLGPDAEPAPFRIDDHDFERLLAQVHAPPKFLRVCYIKGPRAMLSS